MWLIVLEAVGALALFLFLMWWTMFSGRSKGELSEVNEAAAESSEDDAAAGAPKPPADAPGP